MSLRFFVLAIISLFSTPVICDEIHVLSGGAARGFIEPLAARYTQHRIVIEFQTMGHVQKTMASAEARKYDMLLVTPEVAQKLGIQVKPLARVGIGVAVHESAPLPDISTPAALKKTLLATKSVVYINPETGTSGKYVVEMFKKLNILEEMKSKTTLVDSGYAVAPVGEGKVELGIHQISEILPVKGVKLVGPLPAEFQRYTVYAGAAAPGTPKVAAVREFLQYLSSAEARAGLAKAGYSSPE